MSETTKLSVKKKTIEGVKYFIDAENTLYNPVTKEEVGIWDAESKTIKPLPDEEEEDENAAYDLDEDNFTDKKVWDYVRPINFAITKKPDEDNEYAVANQSGDIVSYVDGDNYEGTFEDIIDLGMPVKIDIEHTYPDVEKVFLNCIVGYNGSQNEGSAIFQFPMYWNGTIEAVETEKIETDVNLEQPIGRIEIEVDLGRELPDIDDYSNEDLQRIVMMKINDSDFQPVISGSKVIKSIEDDFLNKVSSEGNKKQKKEKKPKKEKPIPLTEERVKELPVAEPVAPPVTVATKVPDDLSSKAAEYTSLVVIYKTKKAQYETGKTKELKVEILQIKANIEKLLLEIKALKEGKEGKGIDNPDLYNKAKQIADATYSKPSAYKSGFIVKKYKELGGTYSGKKENKGIGRWFQEEWKDVGNQEYPVYRPTKRITKDTPLTPNEIKPSNLKKQIALKQVIKGDANLPPFQGGKVVSLGQQADNISEYDEVYKFSNPKKVQELAKKYLGDGATIFRSTKKDKKYMVYNPNTKKWVHFGQIPYEDFTKHKDEKRRQNYLKRTANMRGNWKDDKYSANNLARNLLW